MKLVSEAIEFRHCLCKVAIRRGMHSSPDLPFAKPQHLHPGLRGKLPAICVSVNTIDYCGQSLVMDRE